MNDHDAAAVVAADDDNNLNVSTATLPPNMCYLEMYCTQLKCGEPLEYTDSVHSKV